MPIVHTYKKYELKSAHEFAWAQTFEAEGLDWAYEAVTFRDGRLSYTPDFLIDGGAFFFEIKPFGGDVKNRIALCLSPLFVIFGMPDRHYVRFKPCDHARLAPGHFSSWKLALDKVLRYDIAA